MYVVGSRNEQPRISLVDSQDQELSLVTEKTKNDTVPRDCIPGDATDQDESTNKDCSSPKSTATKSAANSGKMKQPSERRVQHNYHDHMHDKPPAYLYDDDVLGSGHCFTVSTSGLGGAGLSFTIKLHEMLNTAEREDLKHIVSWQPHGRCFVIHKTELFKELLPRFFGISKIASFQRQLNMYGFQRITRGMDKSGYYHELFLRGRVFLAYQIRRVRIKGTGARAKANPDQEPNFWNMKWLEPLDYHHHQGGGGAQPPTPMNQLSCSSDQPRFTPADARQYSSSSRSDLAFAKLLKEKPWMTTKACLEEDGGKDVITATTAQEIGNSSSSSWHHRASQSGGPLLLQSAAPEESLALSPIRNMRHDMREERRIPVSSQPQQHHSPPPTIPIVSPVRSSPPRRVKPLVECWGRNFHPVEEEEAAPEEACSRTTTTTTTTRMPPRTPRVQQQQESSRTTEPLFPVNRLNPGQALPEPDWNCSNDKSPRPSFSQSPPQQPPLWSPHPRPSRDALLGSMDKEEEDNHYRDSLQHSTPAMDVVDRRRHHHHQPHHQEEPSESVSSRLDRIASQISDLRQLQHQQQEEQKSHSFDSLDMESAMNERILPHGTTSWDSVDANATVGEMVQRVTDS